MKALKEMNPAALQLLKKLIAAACDETRAELGQIKGEFEVDETVVLHATGRVNVSKSTPDAVKAQSAKPWNLVHVLLEELNKERDAAKKAGITLGQVVELAEKVDPDIAKKAKKKADAHVASIKEEVRGFKWGSVTPKGTIEVLASGNHLEDEDDESEAG